MKVEEAKAKLCPLMDFQTCSVGECMAWRWSRVRDTEAYLARVQARMKAENIDFKQATQKAFAEVGTEYSRTEGYCGLAGRPNVGEG